MLNANKKKQTPSNNR